MSVSQIVARFQTLLGHAEAKTPARPIGISDTKNGGQRKVDNELVDGLATVQHDLGEAAAAYRDLQFVRSHKAFAHAMATIDYMNNLVTLHEEHLRVVDQSIKRFKETKP